ncbi:MAG TPA: DinB family protein, partial [Caulobacteraceae bacterium]
MNASTRIAAATPAVEAFRTVRARTISLAAPLSPEDCQAQSMPDASPAKWHLAHTSWFFDRLILRDGLGQAEIDPAYDRLFNSYYDSVGVRVERPERGLMTRPALAEVLEYRARVDAAMTAALADGSLEAAGLVEVFELGLNHEQQHQELMLMDVLHLLSRSPLAPVYDAAMAQPAAAGAGEAVAVAGGAVRVGWDGHGFAFDNETPAHVEQVPDFRLARALTTNADWVAFIDDGGYRRPELWLSDGWEAVLALGWTAPLYWRRAPD